MHEFSMTEDLVRAVEEELDGRGLLDPVSEVHLRLGLFSGAVREPLEFYFEMLTRTGRLAGSRLVVEEVPLALCCRPCQREWQSEDALFVCPACGATDIEILSGREMNIDKVVFADEAK